MMNIRVKPQQALFTYFNINLSNKNPKIANKSAFFRKIQISPYLLKNYQNPSPYRTKM